MELPAFKSPIIDLLVSAMLNCQDPASARRIQETDLIFYSRRQGQSARFVHLVCIHPTDLSSATTESGPHKDDPAAERLGMQPHLQIMCGPMLRYDTVQNGVWHGFALLICSDGGSDYAQKPTLRWSARHNMNPADAKYLS